MIEIITFMRPSCDNTLHPRQYILVSVVFVCNGRTHEIFAGLLLFLSRF